MKPPTLHPKHTEAVTSLEGYSAQTREAFNVGLYIQNQRCVILQNIHLLKRKPKKNTVFFLVSGPGLPRTCLVGF